MYSKIVWLPFLFGGNFALFCFSLFLIRFSSIHTHTYTHMRSQHTKNMHLSIVQFRTKFIWFYYTLYNVVASFTVFSVSLTNISAIVIIRYEWKWFLKKMRINSCWCFDFECIHWFIGDTPNVPKCEAKNQKGINMKPAQNVNVSSKCENFFVWIHFWFQTRIITKNDFCTQKEAQQPTQ